MDDEFLPASMDVARFELRCRHSADQIGRDDYYAITRALIPGGSLLFTWGGRRKAAESRRAGLDALARVADLLHESSHLALFCAITELAEKESASR